MFFDFFIVLYLSLIAFFDSKILKTKSNTMPIDSITI